MSREHPPYFMHILFDTKIQLNSNLEKVWELLTCSQQRAKWQGGIEQIKLVYGDEGYRGARTELLLADSKVKVIEQVRRSRPLERLQFQFDLNGCSYQQTIYLSTIGTDQTQLTYHCRQKVNSSWRRILNIHPAIPDCVKPDIFKSLAQHL